MRPAKVSEAGDLLGKERYVPDIQPLDFGRNDELPIDPYWLGLWLGDGSKSAPIIKCWHKFQQHCRNTVYKITREAKDSHGDLFLSYCFQGLRKKLVDLNLLNNKHIPDIYLYSSVENRLKLLAGLMDTDGEVMDSMGSEDFAEIAQRVPSAYFMMGAGPEQKEKRMGQHNPKIEFNETVLPIGAAIYAQAAKDWLEGK